MQKVFHDLSHVTEMNLLQLDVLSHYNADQTAAEFGNFKKKKKKVYLEMKKNKTAWFCTIKMHTTALFPFEYFSPVG